MKRVLCAAGQALVLLALNSCGRRVEIPVIEYGSRDIVAGFQHGENSLGMLWTDGDELMLLSDEEGTQLRTLKDGAGSYSASFAGPQLVPGVKYAALYPGPDVKLDDEGGLSLDFASAKITSNGSTDHITGPFLSSSRANSEGGASFDLKPASAILKLSLRNPVITGYNSFELLPLFAPAVRAGTVDPMTGGFKSTVESSYLSVALSGVKTDKSKSKYLNLWIPVAPQNLEKDALAAVVHDTYGNLYTARLAGRDLKAGEVIPMSGEMTKWSNDAYSGITVVKNDQKNLTRMGVPYGHYSGITKVSEHRYAVAHDKLNGAGFLYFDMQFDEKGNVTSVDVQRPAGIEGAMNARDAEAIAYVPSSNTIFVCGELDRQILEYDMDAHPTGRRLEIPSDILGDIEHYNRGMESLAYDAARGLFWASTETAMVKDAEYLKKKGRLMRLQSFDSSLKPAERYLYLMDAPEATGTVTDDNQAHGIADLMVLDDGRMVVLEREVFVNTAKLTAWCKVKLYVVDPAQDHGGILSKTLLTKFETSLTSLAAYEGLCSGPVLADGSRTILFVCDSQGGRSFQGLRLPDFIKTVVLK